MNILQVCNKVPYPPKDGGAIAILNLATGFSSKGHRVTILAINTSKHQSDPAAIPSEYNTSIDFIYVPVDTRIRVVRLLSNFFFSRLPYNAARFLNVNFSLQLMHLLKNNKYDIIQLEGLYLTMYIPLIRNHSNALVAFRAHNIEHEIWRRIAATTKNPFKRFYLNSLSRRIAAMEKGAIGDYDLLVPITERDNKKFKELGNTKPVKVSQTGIKEEAFRKYTSKEKAKSIFFIGALDWAPNQEGLLWFLENVWTDLKENIPGTAFHIAGRNAPQWLTEKITRYDTVFHGEIDNALTFFDEYDVMVVPLFAGSGMRIKIVEAMARSKAVVSTSIGAEGIGAVHNWHLVIADDKEEMLTTLRKVLENYEFFVKLEENSFALAKQHFSNEKIAEELLDFYKQHLTQ